MCCSPLKTAKPSLWTYLLRCMMLFSHLLRQYEPTKSLADKWHWKFKLPSPLLFFLFSFSFYFLIIDFCFFPFSLFMTYLNDTLPHRGEKKENKNNNSNTVCSHAKGRGHRWNGRVTSWPLRLRPTGICLSVDGRCWAEVVHSHLGNTGAIESINNWLIYS